MSNDDFSGGGGGPDDTVESPPQQEFSPVRMNAIVTQPESTGDATEVEANLDGTGLDLIARRVLAKRGIDPARMAPSGFESMAQPQPPANYPDILSASVAVAAARSTPLAFETVIGKDNRERVFDTHKYPYSAIAALEITARDGSRYIGTGWFVSPNTVITAGHCVFVHNATYPGVNGWVRSIRVIPGRNGTSGAASEPFGSVTSTQFRSVGGWVNEGNPESDYGAILLPPGSTPNGGQVGTFGIGAFDDADLAAMKLNVAGYPGDKEGADVQTLWFDVKNTAQVTPRQVFYQADTYGGQSGAPVYITQGEARIAVAVHAYGTSAAVTSNAGTRITPEVLKRIESWKT